LIEGQAAVDMLNAANEKRDDGEQQFAVIH
jgi:hypothetical protein